jgi:tetratricopeptide (TPR) repeat protein
MRATYFSLLLLAAVHLSAQSAQELMGTGQQAYQRRDYATALYYFEQAARYDRDVPGLYEYRANTLFMMGRYAEAEGEYGRAIELMQRRGGGFPSAGGETRVQNMVLLEPLPQAQAGAFTLGMLYNNRGVARYLQGRSYEAQEDFRQALAYDRSLSSAQANLGQSGGGQYPSPGPSDPWNQQGSGARYQRPPSRPLPSDLRKEQQATLLAREDRKEMFALDPKNTKPRFKPAEPRKLGSRGLEYGDPQVSAASHSYLRITSVRITPAATFVTILLTNETSQAWDISISAPGSENAFYLTDRSGGLRTLVKLRRVEGIATYPRTTRLEPGRPLAFVLEFPKIPDDMLYVNLLEGSGQTGQEWNFYGIRLTK